MALQLSPYTAYRHSGLDWLGLIPEHWEVGRNSRFFAQRVETGFPDLPVLEVSLRTGVRLRDMEGGRKQQMTDRAKYKVARRGDIAYNMMRMWQGAVGVAPCDGLISPAYVVAIPRSGVDSRYFTYLFRTAAYMREVDLASRGIVPDRNRLYWDYYKALPSPAPPLEEQSRIAGFLDSYTRQIQQLMTVKRHQLRLLGEQRLSIATHILAAHGVFDLPSVRLKRTLLAIVGGSTPSAANAAYWGDDVVWITAPDITSSRRLDRSKRMLSQSGLAACAATVVPAGSVIVTSRAPVGNVAVAVVPLATSQGCKALVPDVGKITTDYLELTAQIKATTMQALSTGTTFQEISGARVGTISIQVPSIDEQRAIIAQVNNESRLIVENSDRVSREIALIQEYRDSLVTAVVTGQVDVREAQFVAAGVLEPGIETEDLDLELEDTLESAD